MLGVFACTTEVNWTADITGRVGFAVDRALIYVKGGVVWADTDYSAVLGTLGGFGGGGFGFGGLGVATSAGDTRVGGLFGVGVEYAFLPNWSAKLEYNYMDFGHADESFQFVVPGPSTVTVNTSINQQIHVVKAGLNYRFDWGRM